MESRQGHYVGLSPMARAAREEFDRIEDARKARAKASLGLKHLQETVGEARRERFRTETWHGRENKQQGEQKEGCKLTSGTALLWLTHCGETSIDM